MFQPLLFAALLSANTLESPPPISNLSRPEPGVLAAGQPTPEQFSALADQGLRHVIDLRRDGETPDFDEAATVASLGMSYHPLPIAGPDDLTPANVRTFDQLLRAAGDEPILAHCGSSNRVGALAALRAAWIDGATPEQALETGRAWGLTSLAGAVEQRIASAGTGAPSAVYPRIEGHGKVFPIPGAPALDVDRMHQLVLDSTAGGEPDKLHPTLERAARALNLYALAGVPAEQVRLAVVVHGDATPLVLNDAAWRRAFGTDNPNSEMLARLADAGVAFHLCGQAMRHRGYVETDIHPAVTIDLSAMTVLATLQAKGHALIP